MNKKYDVISAGEVIMRLSPQMGKILSQEGSLDRNIGGAELNVMIGLSSLGAKTSYITKIPDHDLGVFVKRNIKTNGVSDEYIVYDSSPKKRLALYYYEYGASPRKPSVVYDRNDSSFQFLDISEVNQEAYTKTKIFHISGISLGLCANSNKLTHELINNFKEGGAKISFDVNFRRNLWGNEENARKEIVKILPYIDIFFASEETLIKMFEKKGEIQDIMREFAKEYNISMLISTQREVNSPKSHNFGSTIYDLHEDKFYTEPPYKNIEIVDRIGSGDAYIAGALYGLTKYKSAEKAMEFGNAMGALKNTLVGDVACFTSKAVEAIVDEHKNGSFSEMNR